MTLPRIDVSCLSKAFGGKTILNQVDLRLEEGESFCLIGGSGTGKSVLIKCILGLLSPDEGNVLIDGVNIHHINKKTYHMTMEKLGVLFQGGALFDSLSVWENITFALRHKNKINEREAKSIAVDLLEQVNLPPSIADVYPAQLSGGMQKRVALARAISMKPKVIFFDEPTTGLDPITSGHINSLILRCVKQLGATALTITHDLNSVRSIADRVGLLFEGKLIWVGTLQEFESTNNPYIVQFISGNPEGPFTLL